MHALATGGAGDVGSVVVEELIGNGAEPVVVQDDVLVDAWAWRRARPRGHDG